MHDPRLSSDARARRDAMLPGLLDALAERNRKRARARRYRNLAAVLLIVGATAAIFVRHTPVAPTPVEGTPRSSIVFVQTPTGAVDRYRAAPAALVQPIEDDDALLAALADAGRVTGLIRDDGRLRLTVNVVGPAVNDTSDVDEGEASGDDQVSPRRMP